MKKTLFYILIITIYSASAFALSSRNNWTDIRKNRSVTIIQPKFAEAFGPAGLFNVCLTNGDFKSIEPLDVCLGYENITRGDPMSEMGSYVEKRCTKSSLQDVTISRTHDQIVCRKHEPSTEFSSNGCLQWETQSLIYPDSFLLEVVRTEKLEAGNHLFNKTLKLPMCEYTPAK